METVSSVLENIQMALAYGLAVCWLVALCLGFIRWTDMLPDRLWVKAAECDHFLRECRVFLVVAALCAVTIPVQIAKGDLREVADSVVLTFDLAAILVLARHGRGRQRKQDKVADKRWSDLVAMWRKPVPLPTSGG